MSLTPGTRIGCYEVSAVLGAGGMGEEGTIHPIAQRNYDVTPDGKQFLVVVPAASPADSTRRTSPGIDVVLNWFEELKTRVPVK